ncbi:hypothetical protein [Amnibacterium kyonggiense]|uniref:MFS family arabinose efflux permease n=1 Tax=Amnibacterium kyonggiense TaxID=595671 RepID=A0A4R7FHG3_9MICO|nr:hypothetical protein [Amnibacterium kyonggiense]TDS75604.1 hypothetical protein CLV52_2711 [Amnibacterium kyonggiense]
MRTYGRLLSSPTTTVSLVAALVGAIPIGMWPLTIVLGALDAGGTGADAGVLAAVFGVGNAVGVVSQGALLSRVRAAVLLPLFAVLGIVAAALLSGGVVLAGAALAGIAIPAVTPAVRGRLATSVPGADRPGAYALVNVLFQAGIAIGPLVAAALAAGGLIGVAPAIAAGGGLVAAGLLAVAHRSRLERPAGAVRVGPMGRGALVLIAAAGAAGFGIGTLQVLVPVRSTPAMAGAAFALLALAEVAGAVLLGGRARPGRAFRMLVAGTGGMALLYVLLQLGLAPVPAAVALGLATAVQSLGSALALDRFVPPARIPAVFAVQVALVILGAAAGSFTAGVLPDGAFAIAAALLAVAGAALLGLARRPVLRPAPTGPRAVAR